MGIKHICASAVNPSILTVMALIALTDVRFSEAGLSILSTYSNNSNAAYV
jgi:hypothetical protein